MGIWVEVFRPGKWNGKYFGPEVVDQLIEAYEANKEELKVPVRVGSHDGIAPAGGWVTGLRKQGERLMAELSDVPKVVGEAINRRLFKQVSIGTWRNHKDTQGRTWPRVMDHIAILGGRLPAVRGLEDLPALFDESRDDTEVITLENEEFADLNGDRSSDHDTEVYDMDPKVLQDQLERLGKQNEQLTAQRDELTAKNAELEKRAEKLAADLEAKGKEHEALQKQHQEMLSAAAESEVNAVVDAAVKDGRLLPKQKDGAVKTGLALRRMDNFAADDSPFKAWREDLEARGKSVDTREKAPAGGEDQDEGEQLDEFEKEFAEGQKIVAGAQGKDK